MVPSARTMNNLMTTEPGDKLKRNSEAAASTSMTSPRNSNLSKLLAPNYKDTTGSDSGSRQNSAQLEAQNAELKKTLKTTVFKLGVLQNNLT